MQVSVYRYNPDLDEVPVMRDVQVDLPEGKDTVEKCENAIWPTKP